MIARRSIFVLFCMLVTTTGCLGPVRGIYPPTAGESSADVYIYNNHWHTGFVIPWSQLSPTLQRDLSRFGVDTRRRGGPTAR